MKRWTGIIFANIDMLLSLMVIFIALVTPVHPKTEASDKPICQLAIDIEWPMDRPADVDLWVMAPGDVPVGYSNKEGRVFNLVRDDLGNVYSNDPTNAERACARMLVDGPWATTAHLYSNLGPLPIPVRFTISIVDPSSAIFTRIAEGNIELNRVGEEATLLNFKLEDGKIVTGSMNDIPIHLRAKKDVGH